MNNHPDFDKWWNGGHEWKDTNDLRAIALDAYCAGADAMERSLKSEDLRYDTMLSSFYCGHHSQMVLIVHREPRALVLSCGCVYRVDSATGAEWINSTAPKGADK